MCRLLVCLTVPRSREIKHVIRQHMLDLDHSLGGMGCGLWLPKYKFGKRSLIKRMKAVSILKRTRYPFFFHTRLATSGNVCIRNCHPWIHKHVVLMHNGFAWQYVNPPTNSDSYNLLIAWQRQQTDLSTMAWHGNIITYDKTDGVIRCYIQNSMEKVTLHDGTVLITSQLTPSIDPYCDAVETLHAGVYEARFYNGDVTYVRDMPAESMW